MTDENMVDQAYQLFLDKLQDLRKQQGWSYRQLAERSGTNAVTVWRVLEGKQRLTTSDILFKWLIALGVDPDTHRQFYMDMMNLAGLPAPWQVQDAVKRTTEHEIPQVPKPKKKEPDTSDDLEHLPPVVQARYTQARALASRDQLDQKLLALRVGRRIPLRTNRLRAEVDAH